MPKPPVQPNATNGTNPNSTTPNSTAPNATNPHPWHWTPLVYPFVIHPLLPVPIYTYIGPFTTYPVFPVERWPDNPFDPRLYPGYPVFPNDKITPPKPPVPSCPTDVKLIWPQNPYYTWPTSADFKWPEDLRFKWPESPNDPRWFWPADPTLDPKWRRPDNDSCLPPILPQRWPWDPVFPNTTINNTSPFPNSTTPTNQTTPNTTNPANNTTNPGNNSTSPNNTSVPVPPEFKRPDGTVPPFSYPNVSEPSQPRPGFIAPDPTWLYLGPYSLPPFPIGKVHIPSVYKGIPN